MSVKATRFAIVPEWVLEAPISDRAVRLYGILRRYADQDLRAHPGRRALAERLRCSVDSVDRAVRELVQVGAMIVTPRRALDGDQLTNDYRLADGQSLRPRRTLDEQPALSKAAATPLGKAAALSTSYLNESHSERDWEGCHEGTPSPPAAPALRLEDQGFWSGRLATLARLREACVPDELLEPAFMARIKALTAPTRVYWDDELIKYQTWWGEQPPSVRRRQRRRQFHHWVVRAVAQDNNQRRKEEDRDAGAQRRPYQPR